jgi:outer membrane biosynthesis protein TonB
VGVPPKSSGTAYAIGALILGVGIVALLYTRCKDDKAVDGAQPVSNVKPVPSPSEVVQSDLPEFAPPPPPEPDAGADAGPEATPSGTARVATGDKAPPSEDGGACAKCGQGEANASLTSAVQGTAGSAQGCYNRALRSGGAEGRLNVAVAIGANGSVCSASITSDSVGDPAISQCVLGKFKGRSYPKPTSGCVVVNVPINFKVRG